MSNHLNMTAEIALGISKSLKDRMITLHVDRSLETIYEAATGGLTKVQVLLPPDVKNDCISLLKEMGYKVTESGNGALVDWSNP